MWPPDHTARLARLAGPSHIPTPADVFSKYAGHPLIRFTHILPSGVWSLCGALQLSPRARASYPHLHRLSGRLMLISAVLVAVGYIALEAAGLATGQEEGESTASMRVLMVWFVVTGWMAWVKARGRRYKEHRAWALRHIASGAWPIVQRVIVICLSVVGEALGWEYSKRRRLEVFVLAATLAVAVTFVACEVHLRATARNSNRITSSSGSSSGGSGGVSGGNGCIDGGVADVRSRGGRAARVGEGPGAKPCGTKDD